jgi:DNA-binding XRE family transcriptional regulator
MKIHPQLITKKGQPLFVVLPYNEYQTILSTLEDIIDIEAVIASQNDAGEPFPLDVVERIAAGENAIKIFREYRELTQSELAEQAGISRQYMFQIENNERVGATSVLKKIAKCLAVSLDDIVEG